MQMTSKRKKPKLKKSNFETMIGKVMPKSHFVAYRAFVNCVKSKFFFRSIDFRLAFKLDTDKSRDSNYTRTAAT